jgi:hypothetical protein
MTTVKFKVWHRQYRPGDIATFPDGVAQTMIQYHRATLVRDSQAATVTDDNSKGTEPQPPAFTPDNKMLDTGAVKKKKGRPVGWRKKVTA